jgi:antitoxin component of RelBE/YafQ-DinJ toxin-antitoxin module
MKRVIVYTTKKTESLSHGHDIPHYSFSSAADLSFQAGEMFVKQTINEIRLPIQRFCWSDGREVFAAFDEELLEMIGCLQDQKDMEIYKAAKEAVERAVKPLEEQISSFHSMKVWKRFKFFLFGL